MTPLVFDWFFIVVPYCFRQCASFAIELHGCILRHSSGCPQVRSLLLNHPPRILFFPPLPAVWLGVFISTPCGPPFFCAVSCPCTLRALPADPNLSTTLFCSPERSPNRLFVFILRLVFPLVFMARRFFSSVFQNTVPDLLTPLSFGAYPHSSMVFLIFPAFWAFFTSFCSDHPRFPFCRFFGHLLVSLRRMFRLFFL